MKRFIAVFMTVVLLTGCGASAEETAVAESSVEESSAEESSIEEAPVEESKEEVAEEVKEYSEDELINITYNFFHTADLSAVANQGNIITDELYIFAAYSLAGDISGNACYQTPGSKTTVFSPEVADKVNNLFMKGYESFISKNVEVIDEAYLEFAKECADAKKGPKDLSLEPLDVSEKFPDKIELLLDDKTIELDVIGTELNYGVSREVKGSTDDAKVPYWKADDGTDNYLFSIGLRIKVPKEQIVPVISYFNDIITEDQTPKEEEKAEPAPAEEKKADEAPKTTEQQESSIDLTGTWYDPTGLSVVQFTFNGDGTGTVDWGGSTSGMTYSVSGGTVNCQMSNSSYSLKIQGDKLSDGESKYVKR